MRQYIAPISFIIFLSLQGCRSDYSEFITPEGFQLEEGLDLRLVASEPLIKDPVDLEYDEKGDAYVLQMPGYPYEDTQSSIVILHDEDTDGVYDSSTVFASHLEMASSILPYDGGLLVAAPPYLLLIKDTTGDLMADQRDTLLGGFSVGNLQHNYNGLTYGIDGWIYAANGGNSGSPFWWGRPTDKIDLKGDDFRINLNDQKIERIGPSSGGYELAIDPYNRIMGTHNLEHISQIILPQRYLHPQLINTTQLLHNISDHEDGGLSRIYPIGEQETRVNHPEQSGYFSGACGITYYGGGAYGETYTNTVWIADVVLNLVHVDQLKTSGTHHQAIRKQPHKEVVASSDRSSRPVNLTVSPKGHLMIVDMYRDIIEHPEWIPDELEIQIDLDKGKDQGRIYEIIPKKKTSQWETLGSTSNTELISHLSHTNQWVRNTAQRLLVKRSLTSDDYDQLSNSLSSPNAFARLHGLWILQLKKRLDATQLSLLLQDMDPGIRENALVISESFNHDQSIVRSIINMISEDTDPRVRLYAGLITSTFSSEILDNYQESIKSALLKSLNRERNQWSDLAIANAGLAFEYDFIKEVAESGDAIDVDHLISLLIKGARDHPNHTSDILNIIANATQDKRADLLTALVHSDPAPRANDKIKSLIQLIETSSTQEIIPPMAQLRKALTLPVSQEYIALTEQSLQALTNTTLSVEQKMNHLENIQLLDYNDKRQVLATLLSPQEPKVVQEEVIAQLWKINHADVGHQLIQLWQTLSPIARQQASDILLYKKIHHPALLTGLESGIINIGEMNFDLERRRTLLWWTEDADIKRRAQALFSDSGVVTRQEAMSQMKEALMIEGDSEHGLEVYAQLCGQCHIYKTLGVEVGPVLTEINRKSKASLLHDIVDPNAAVDTRYISHSVETNDGSLHVGIIHSEDDHQITIKKMGGTTVQINRSDITSFKSLGSSLMMEELEQQMNTQDMADLLAFLQNG